MSIWHDIYLAQSESIQVTQRWLDWELGQEEPDMVVIAPLTDLLKTEINFLQSIERRLADVNP